MKKIRLNVADLGATEILSRDQLKSIFGGSGSGSSLNGTCGVNIYCGTVRVKKIRGYSQSEAQAQASAFMTDSDAIAFTCSGYSGTAKAYWCCDSCD